MLEETDHPSGSEGPEPDSKQALRRRAKADASKASRRPKKPDAQPPNKTRALDHELQVHQIEELRRTQRALEASRSRLADFYDFAPVAYFTMSEKGLILEANRTAAQLLGVERDRVIKQPLSQFILPEDQDIYYRYRQTLLAAAPARPCELRMLRKGAPHFWAQLEARVAQEADGRPVLQFAASDISERKQLGTYRDLGREILQMLNESNDLKDCAQRLIGLLQERTGCEAVGIRLQDGDDYPYFAQKGFPEGFLRTENTLVERRADGGLCRDKSGNISLGCTCGLVITGKTDPAHPLCTAGGSCWTNDSCRLLDIPPGEDPRTNPRNTCVHQGYASVALVPIRNKEQVIGLIQFNDRRKGHFSLAMVELLEGIAAHIGAALLHKRDEEKILRLAAIITQADDAIISTDHKGIITSWNPAAQKIFGYGAEEALGRSIALLAPTDRQNDEMKGNLEKILGGQNVQYESPRRAKSGALIEIWASLFPIKDSAGSVMGVSGIYHDNTERKQAAAEREKLQAQLTQSQKMESIGRLAGGVAHDFNNLLTAIKGYGEFILDALPEADPQRADTEEILKAADRAAALTQQLLAFSRRQILAPRVVDLNAAIPVTAKMLQRLIGEDIKLELKLSPQPCPIRMDPGQLDQVILNLVLNARDAMPDGGTVTLETEITAMDEGFFAAHPGLTRGPLAILRVRDTGHGMTNEVKSHIFEPFFTTKSIGQGTGLGLATIFGIITQSGGSIEVESAPERGATFLVYFPRAEKTAQDAYKDKDKDKDKSTPVRGRETVLLVEDEEVIRRLAERALTGAGYTVLTAADGREALKALEQRGQPVDLLLTDVVMPGMNGRQLAHEVALRKMAPRTLFVSGYTDDAIVRLGMLQPGLAFLHKPFSPEALLRKMREVLDGPVKQAKA